MNKGKQESVATPNTGFSRVKVFLTLAIVIVLFETINRYYPSYSIANVLTRDGSTSNCDQLRIEFHRLRDRLHALRHPPTWSLGNATHEKAYDRIEKDLNRFGQAMAPRIERLNAYTTKVKVLQSMMKVAAAETAKTCWETYQDNIDSKISVAFVPGKSVMMESTSVKLLCDFMSADKDVLEWGSGGSTNFFSQFVKHWDTIEHDAVWASKIKQQALKGVDYHTVPTNWKASRDGNYDEFKEYVEFPKTLNKQWDVILIDGRARVACAESVLRNHLLKKDGIVVVHDWERDHTYKDPDSNYKKIKKYYDVVTEDISGARHLGILKPKKKYPV